MPLPRRLRRLLLLAVAFFCAALFLPFPALAAGNVNVANREPTEVDGRWKLAFTIDYGSIPQLPHIPMIFSFTPTVLYERSLNDKSPEKPVLVRMPLSNQSGINESMDVGFSDATGKIFKITKFDFVIRRDHGFEAGEYDLKIKREDDGVQMGQIIKLVLHGDNPVVDRRAITFAGEKKKKVTEDKGDKPADEGDKKPEEAAGEPKADAPETTDAAPPPVPPKQGGCGCHVAGERDGDAGALVAAAALAAAVAARRRRR